MADPFIAEVRIFPFNFAPTGWAFCNGGLLPISQNTALFSLLGVTYGGDGKSTFALPDLKGSAMVHPLQGPGLSSYAPGQQGGEETVTLLTSEMPFHTHFITAHSEDVGNNTLPGPTIELASSAGATAYVSGSPPLTQMAFGALGIAGGSLPHNNMMPYLTLNFCIAMQGVFPPRS